MVSHINKSELNLSCYIPFGSRERDRKRPKMVERRKNRNDVSRVLQNLPLSHTYTYVSLSSLSLSLPLSHIRFTSHIQKHAQFHVPFFIVTSSSSSCNIYGIFSFPLPIYTLVNERIFFATDTLTVHHSVSLYKKCWDDWLVVLAASRGRSEEFTRVYIGKSLLGYI